MTQQTNQPEKQTSYYSQPVWVLVLCGLVGFFISIMLLLGIGSNNNRFHEISIKFKKIDSLALDSTERFLTYYEDSLKKKRAEKDSNKINASIDSLDKLLQQIAVNKFELQYGNKDTGISSIPRYTINRDSLSDIIKRFPNSGSLTFGYYNPELSKKIFSVKDSVYLKPYPSSLDFFSRYPNYALCIFLAIIQMVMWFLMAPICIAIYTRIKKQIVVAALTYRWWKSFFISLGSVIVFCLLLYFVMADKFIITDKYFMKGLGTNIALYSAVGYVVAILCFTGYLYIADFIHQLQDSFIQGSDKIKKLTAGKDNENPQLASTEINDQHAQNDFIKQQYELAKKYFNLFFGMTALVLSIVVLWIATVFTSINSMEIFKYFKSIAGVNFLPNDFVYLFGGLHSILLLLFFLPVKFNMYSLNLAVPELQEPSNPKSGYLNEGLKNIAKTIGDILLVSSPLLASLLHNLLSAWTN